MLVRADPRTRPRCRCVVRDDVVDVGELPAGSGQVDREKVLLPAEAVAGVEAAHVEQRRPAGDRAAGEEAEDRRARSAAVGGERARAHGVAGRVEPAAGLDEDARREQSEARMGVEHRRGAAQRAGGPPRVVVGERDERCCGRRDAAGPGRGSDVARQPQDRDLREGLFDRVGGPVARGVVDDDHRRALGQRGEPGERLQQPGTAVPRRDDHGRYAGPGRRRGRHASDA